VQTVGQQGHRTEEDAGCDFDNHHGPGNGDDNDGASLTRAFLVLPEPMAVLPRMMFIVLHHLFDTKRLMKVNGFFDVIEMMAGHSVDLAGLGNVLEKFGEFYY
jgi:hypothetical protein